MFKLAVVLSLVAVCLADNPYRPSPYSPAPYKQASYDHYDSPKYTFDWAVKDDYTYNNYGQQESRDGYNTDGSYWVLLPDGRVQTVKYYVNGDSGFVADVSYSGEPKYDASYHKPTYAPAPAHYKPAPYRPATYRPAPYKAAHYAPAPYAPAPYAPYRV